jgi:hypothetical protein
MPHAELACDSSGSGVVPGVDSTLGGLGMEAEGSSEGSEGGKFMLGTGAQYNNNNNYYYY